MLEWLIIGGIVYFIGGMLNNQSETERLKREIQTLQTSVDKTTLILAGHETRIQFLEHLSFPQKMSIHHNRIKLADFKCRACGRATVLRLNYRNPDNWNYGNFFLGCSGYPSDCREIAPLSKDIEQRLLGEIKLIQAN